MTGTGPTRLIDLGAFDQQNSRTTGEHESNQDASGGTSAMPQLIDIPPGELPVFCYPAHFHAMIENLTLFNGIETVGEVKIV